MDRIRDPRPTPSRQPGDVPCTFVTGDDGLETLDAALATSVATAIDTETVFVEGAIGPLRVVSIAVRAPDGDEQAFVVDVALVDRDRLARVLGGTHAAAWNADFDARVLDQDLLEPARRRGQDVDPITWWDGQLADALLHQGMSGFGFYHGLAWAAEWYLGVRAEGKGTTQLSYTADDPLDAEQVRYAAADAVETLWVADVLRREIDAAGLTVVCELEQTARPFLDHMERAGLPFDWDGWDARLAEMESDRRTTLSRLAELTGGGQGTLFSDDLEPSWNPGSERQTKEMLNAHCTDLVHAWTERTHGTARPLEPTDPLPASVLEEIGGPLCEALLEFRDLTKVLSTYGDSIREHIGPDGRLHPEYLQVVGTNTGRLASRNPNAQNLSPRMKPHLRPADDGRVFVTCDLSQAELRFVAQVSGDAGLRQAFLDGVDVHEATAERMFGVDMPGLRATDAARYAELRATSKRINFGIVYGQRGAGLARSLTLSGVETSRREGADLLDSYLAAYPDVARWADERDRFIEELARSRPDMDWVSSLRLHELWRPVRAARNRFRDENRRWPTVEDVWEALERTEPVDAIAWTMSFTAPVALAADGTPFGFASTTPAGRRQQFTIHTDSVLASAARTALTSAKDGPRAVRRRLAATASGRLDPTGDAVDAATAAKLLEDRQLRRAVVDTVTEVMGVADCARLLDGALAERVARLANAYRNAPIQGGVADVMLDAYGSLHERLADFDSAVGVQTVHDSVVVECDRAEAHDVAAAVKGALEDAMARWCPDIPALADTEIRSSLSDDDIELVLGADPAPAPEPGDATEPAPMRTAS